MRPALEGGEHGLGRGRFASPARCASLPGKCEARAAFLLGAGEVAGGLMMAASVGLAPAWRFVSAPTPALRGSARRRSRSVGEAALAGRVLREPERQDAERARRQPDRRAPVLTPRSFSAASSWRQPGARARDRVADGASPFRPALGSARSARQVVDVVGAEPAAGLVPSPRISTSSLSVVRSGRSRTVRRGHPCRGHDQDLGADLGEDRARRRRRRRQRARAPGPARSRAAPARGRALDEAEQLLPQCRPASRWLRARSHALLSRSMRSLGADRGAQLVEASALVGWKVERLQLQGHGHQPGPALAGERQRLLGLAALGGRKAASANRARLASIRSRASASFEPLAEQQQECLARARVGQPALCHSALRAGRCRECARRADGRAARPRGCDRERRLEVAIAFSRLSARSPRMRSA